MEQSLLLAPQRASATGPSLGITTATTEEAATATATATATTTTTTTIATTLTPNDYYLAMMHAAIAIQVPLLPGQQQQQLRPRRQVRFAPTVPDNGKVTSSAKKSSGTILDESPVLSLPAPLEQQPPLLQQQQQHSLLSSTHHHQWYNSMDLATFKAEARQLVKVGVSDSVATQQWNETTRGLESYSSIERLQHKHMTIKSILSAQGKGMTALETAWIAQQCNTWTEQIATLQGCHDYCTIYQPDWIPLMPRVEHIPFQFPFAMRKSSSKKKKRSSVTRSNTSGSTTSGSTTSESSTSESGSSSTSDTGTLDNHTKKDTTTINSLIQELQEQEQQLRRVRQRILPPSSAL